MQKEEHSGSESLPKEMKRYQMPKFLVLGKLKEETRGTSPLPAGAPDSSNTAISYTIS